MFHACVAVFRAEPGRISQCLFNGGVFQSVQSVLLVDGGGCGITYLSLLPKQGFLDYFSYLCDVSDYFVRSSETI